MVPAVRPLLDHGASFRNLPSGGWVAFRDSITTTSAQRDTFLIDYLQLIIDDGLRIASHPEELGQLLATVAENNSRKGCRVAIKCPHCDKYLVTILGLVAFWYSVPWARGAWEFIVK
ncbi:hypothetical protein FQN54_002782 [Arachnomyces sp. PD_36]|nr:hypothetical protein FQN54_002782 [Arachnomyces sp. PD_36]